MHLFPNYNLSKCSRADPLLDPHGREQGLLIMINDDDNDDDDDQGLDAGHLLQEREDWGLPQHPDPQPLHPCLS